MSHRRSSQLTPLLAPESNQTAGTALQSHVGERAPIRVIIAISSGLEGMAWGIIISNQTDMQLIGQVTCSEEALAILRTQCCDVTLIDDAILDADQDQSLWNYSMEPSSSRFVLVAPHQLDYSQDQSRYAFAQTYLLKGVSSDELLRAIRASAENHDS
jgi:DNA-binding NarL/FixJ family response regulator